MRTNRPWRDDSGEVASWLIVAAALALAATLAAGTLGDVIRSLAGNVAESAQVEGSAAPSDAPSGPADGGPGANSPTPADPPSGPADGGPGANSPTPADPPGEEGGDGDDPADGDVDECVNIFHPVACSSSQTARDAFDAYEWYDMCAVARPPIWCQGFVPGVDAGIRTILDGELGADPGDLFLAAAHICDANGPGCELWLWIANFVYDNRAAIAATGLVGDILPTPSGVGCVAAVADGSLTAGEATECAIGLGTGLGLPIPAGVIDVALDG